MKFSFAAVAVIALAGCIQSTAPLESDAAKPSEPTLLGHWKSDLDGDPMVATIRQAKNGDLEADVLANWEPGPKAAEANADSPGSYRRRSLHEHSRPRAFACLLPGALRARGQGSLPALR